MQILHRANLEPWKKIGDPRTLGTTRFLNAWEQDFEDPRTRHVYSFSLVTLSDGAFIIPITTHGTIILVQQFMQAADAIDTDFPGGGLKGDPQTTAITECREETGYVPERVEPLCQFVVNPRQCPSRQFGFVGFDCRAQGQQTLDAAESIQVIEVTPRELLEMIERGDIRDPCTCGAVAHAIAKRFIVP